MKLPRTTLVASAIAAVLCAAVTLSVSAVEQTASDNSEQNQNRSETSDRQPNTKADRLTTAHIRKVIVADKELSTYGHNVKIITTTGAVTLLGPVKSEQEKEKIASDVAVVVSADKITNDLTIQH